VSMLQIAGGCSAEPYDDSDGCERTEGGKEQNVLAIDPARQKAPPVHHQGVSLSVGSMNRAWEYTPSRPKRRICERK
jgi:hypothetical protein